MEVAETCQILKDRDQYEGSATNAQKPFIPVHYVKCVHTVNGTTHESEEGNVKHGE